MDINIDEKISEIQQKINLLIEERTYLKLLINSTYGIPQKSSYNYKQMLHIKDTLKQLHKDMDRLNKLKKIHEI
jgi:hypothetical protein